MKQIEVKIGKTPAGYSAAIDILPGWIVAVTGSFADIRKEIEDSIAFYIECAQRDGEPYPKVFNSKYELIYKFDVESLLYCFDKIISKADTDLAYPNPAQNRQTKLSKGCIYWEKICWQCRFKNSSLLRLIVYRKKC